MPATVVLALLMLRHYVWNLAPAQHQALVWNICGAIVVLALLYAPRPNPAARLALLWWCCEEALVVACSGAYIIRPWQVDEGKAMCSALLGFDVGLIGIAIIVCLLSSTVRLYRSKNDE